MATVLDGRVRMERATLASVGFHVAVALAIPALAWTASSAVPVETVSFTHILHVTVVPTRPPLPPPRAVAQHRGAKADVSFSRAHLVNARPSPHSAVQRAIATNASAAPAVGVVQRVGEGSANSDVAPNVTPSPAARAVASVGTHQAGGYLPFGAEQPDPVLDPGVRKQLDTLGAHVTLVVTVGNDGRTENITFDPQIDPALESRIRSLLADASWDPAVCGGGVACEATATIKL